MNKNRHLKKPIKRKAVILLSGGLDSSTVLYWAKEQGYKCYCLIFDYNQRHKKELVSAKKLASISGCPYKVVKIKLPWDKSSLIDKNKKIPVKLPANKKGKLPTTYIPGRNTIFISFAISYAESIGASAVFIGANAIDYSGYPDCRPKYYNALNRVLRNLGTGLRIRAPLLKLKKSGIIRLGTRLKTPYALTWSCYMGEKTPCGKCDSCKFREKGFREAGIKDPSLKKQ
ncbi:MAG: 7-cyano-7-deazaguanine synthase QueC [Endomicrobiales bacterium]|nr:7-cyano-7-deazaguanine synthase QueC [Endomicrobiales bacterium]